MLFAATGCDQHEFFGLPTWYKYLVAAGKMAPDPGGGCSFVAGVSPPDFALVGLALVDIALRLAGLIAVAYVIWGGIQYVTSQGEPDRATRARGTIVNALIGLTIALIATGLVSFVGTQVGK
ncbi:MAG TPA: hypothetical protein VLE73_05025 [Candidatus Saccharimonadales bacterium]|nr:hypothetical protein [Candidatus Saccharimonadales bacterium]